jgi:UDP-N-acetylglucosamine 2-epimerase
VRIVSVVGARPQFVKAAPVSRELRRIGEEILVHSGQHYDAAMSDVFFAELGIPAPDYDLGVGSGPHGQQTGVMLGLLEKLFVQVAPDAVLVYGDTNTTLAGGLAAAKLGIPVVHVEAGLRSFNRAMPEEINRVAVDHLSELLFCPTQVSADNLAAEGIRGGVHVVGDVMMDTLRLFAERATGDEALQAHAVRPGEYFLATVHRAGNADDPAALASLIAGLAGLDAPVLWAVHPRTRARLAEFGLESAMNRAENLRVLDPLSYLETMTLLRSARALFTDSGGMQKEAYFFGVPCVTLREETEWIETVELGWNTLVGTDPTRIIAAARGSLPPAERPPVYGDGHAAERITRVIAEHLKR